MQAEMVVFAGDCRADTLVLDEPLSFWGGLDPQTGLIIDERHPQKGQSVAGRILLMPGTRGSTSAAGALCESLRLGTGPAAFILPAPDALILAAVTIAAELYDRVTPVLVVDMVNWPELTRCKMLKIDADGNVSGMREA
jgi:hypothetical protein